MIAMALTEAAEAMQGKLYGHDARFAGVSTDTRSLEQGNLFVALVGERFNGHDYVGQAEAEGAAGVTVSAPVTTGLSRIHVEDTRLALGALAAHWRARFDIPLIGITGSNGKTTVKEMIAAIMGVDHAVLATRGNLNNDIGVPLMLARLDTSHTAAVIEMGANHHGEIAYLTGLARPTVALITNAGPAHLEGFGSIEGVARAKAEIYQGLGTAGTAVINADDAYAGFWLEQVKGLPVITFGLDAAADVSAECEAEAVGQRLKLNTPRGAVELSLSLPGRHNAMNALAATAAALAAGASLEAVKAGLEAIHPVKGRLQVHHCDNNITLIDDTYNANPGSLQAGLDVLKQMPGEHWLVLGDMGELGETAEALHREIGDMAASADCHRLFTLGGFAARAASTFGGESETFAEMDDLLSALKDRLHAGVAVLVKGSRRMRMERVIEALLPVQGGCH